MEATGEESGLEVTFPVDEIHKLATVRDAAIKAANDTYWTAFKALECKQKAVKKTYRPVPKWRGVGMHEWRLPAPGPGLYQIEHYGNGVTAVNSTDGCLGRHCQLSGEVYQGPTKGAVLKESYSDWAKRMKEAFGINV